MHLNSPVVLGDWNVPLSPLHPLAGVKGDVENGGRGRAGDFVRGVCAGVADSSEISEVTEGAAELSRAWAPFCAEELAMFTERRGGCNEKKVSSRLSILMRRA